MIRLRPNISASQVTSRASFLCMGVLRRQVLLQSAVAIVLSQCSWLAACPADSFRWSPLAELQEAALGSGTTRPWSTRSHAEMRETSPLTIIAYRGCRHTDPPDSSNVTPAQHQIRALGLKLLGHHNVGSRCDRGWKDVVYVQLPSRALPAPRLPPGCSCRAPSSWGGSARRL